MYNKVGLNSNDSEDIDAETEQRRFRRPIVLFYASSS